MQAIAITLSGKKINIFTALKNYIPLLSLKIIKPYGIGDYITVNGKAGFVESISFHETMLKTINNTHVVLQNNNISLNWAVELAMIKASKKNI